MDIVLPLCKTSEPDHRELRYALRSWHQHCPEATPIVVGERPWWYAGRHVPFIERSKMNANTNAKLKHVLESLTDPFVFSADDIYLLDTPQWGPFHRSTPNPAQRSYYRDAIPPDALNCELHIPLLMTKDRAREVLKVMHPHQALRSTYLHGTESTPMDDVKVEYPPPPGWWVFSTTNDIKVRMSDFLRTTYTVPSPWEKLPS